MKILNVVYSLGKGGTERAAQNFAFGYANIGCDSRVIYTRIDGPRREYIEAREIPVYALVSDNDLQIIKDWSPDVVHIHSHGVTSIEFEAIASVTKNAKFVETNVFSRPSPWAAKIAISYQLSEWCLWLFRRRSRVDYPAAIVPYPVDITSFSRVSDELRNDFRKKYGVEKEDILLGRVGQHFNGKWSIVLIDVFEAIRNDDARVKLVVVNPPDVICARIASSKYKSDIVHIDSIHGDENLAVCYSAIDIFVLVAEQGESFGMVLAESLLCETPVITLSTPWADNSQGEVIGNGVGGFVAANKKELIPILMELVNDKSLRKKMGANGRAHIIQRYDLNAVAKKSLELIEKPFPRLILKSAYDLMLDSQGKINITSRLVLHFERIFGLLAYTLGYMPTKYFIIRVYRSIIRRLVSKLKPNDMAV